MRIKFSNRQWIFTTPQPLSTPARKSTWSLPNLPIIPNASCRNMKTLKSMKPSAKWCTSTIKMRISTPSLPLAREYSPLRHNKTAKYNKSLSNNKRTKREILFWAHRFGKNSHTSFQIIRAQNIPMSSGCFCEYRASWMSICFTPKCIGAAREANSSKVYVKI